jgi:hypothetical protein
MANNVSSYSPYQRTSVDLILSKHKSWRTTLLLPWAAMLMIAGFAVRLAGAYDMGNLVYVVASTVLIMSGPPVYALINYCTYRPITSITHTLTI